MSPEQALDVLRALADAMPAREGSVRLDLSGPLATLTLDNPSARNALTARMMIQLADAVQELSGWDGSALLLRATPCGVFCAGGHLVEVRAALTSPEPGRAMAVAMGAALDRLLDLPFVSVAAIDGAAMGGGAELITACDHRVLSRGAQVHFVHARLGVATGWGGAARLVRHVGRSAALRLLSTAAPLSADEAARLGLADLVVDGAADEAARAFLAPVLALPVEAVRAVKAQVAGARPDAQVEAFASVWGGPAHRRALEGR